MTPPPADAWSLAVDFGTSNTAAAYLSRGQVRSIRLESGSTLMPSAVMAADDGYRVGRAAANQQRLHPEAFEAAPKKRLGEGTIMLGSGEVEPVKLIAEIFRSVRQKALAVAGGTEPSTVWLTYPDAWPPSRVQLLRYAAEIAGFAPESIRLVSEPVAAVQHYASETSLAEGARLAVFDFGGGTCDVAVLVKSPDPATGASFTVIGSEGDSLLGGTDFDERIYEWVLEQLEARGDTEIVDLLTGKAGLRARLSLRSSVREAKEELSSHASSVIPVVVGDSETLVAITRTEYEGIIAHEIERALALSRRVLERTGTAPGTLDRLYLTGGSSLTPAIIRGLKELAGVTPATLDDPKLVVAQGALLTPLPPAQSAEPPLPPVVEPAPVPEPEPEPDPEPAVVEEPAAVVVDSIPVFAREEQPVPAAPLAYAAAAPAASATVPWFNRPTTVLAIIGGGLVLTVIAGLVIWGVIASQTAPQSATNTHRTSTTDTETETIDCWDGSEVDEGDGCPELEGAAAAEWAFFEPAGVASKFSCVRHTPGSIEYSPDGWDELFVCSTPKATTSVYITRWSSTATMDASWDSYWAAYDSSISTAPYYGMDSAPTGTDYSESGPVYLSDVLKYYDIPFSLEVYSLYDQQGVSNDDVVDGHYEVWATLLAGQGKTEIANVLETIG